MATKYTLPDGTEVMVQEMRFNVISEPWAEYQLEDGTTVRFRASAVKIFRILDDKGDPALTRTGEPWVIVRNTRIVTASEEVM